MIMSERRSKRINVRYKTPYERDNQGKFTNCCGSSDHLNTKAVVKLINLQTRQRLTSLQYKTLVESGVVDYETEYTCETCFRNKLSCENLESNEIHSENSSEIQSDDSESNEDDTLNYIELGKSLKTLLRSDITKLYNSHEGKLLDDIVNYEPLKWLANRPPQLVHLLASICNLDVNTSSVKKLKVFTKIIEMIYFCQNSKLVLPNCFIENLLAYSLTNCKKYSNFLGSRSPGGSYYYLSSWLNQQADNPIKCPPGLIKAVFDNNQKIGRTYAITGNNTVPSIVMTSHLWITFESGNEIQNRIDLKPDSWMWNLNVDTEKNVLNMLTESGPDFRKSRDNLVKTCIEAVVIQCGNKLEDYIDNMATVKTNSKSEKNCTNCGCEADITFRLCRYCGGKVTKCSEEVSVPAPEITINAYDSFSDMPIISQNISCTIGEPDFINPNSYRTITQVVQNIGVRAGLRQYDGNAREWLLVECDGLPCRILRDIICNVFRCTICNDCFYGTATYEEHKCFILHKHKSVREFGWVVPVNGLLHFEMNFARSFMKLNWKVFCSLVGYELGFRSPKAQEFLKKGFDHHKTWQFLEIIYVILSLELVTPYVKYCLAERKKAFTEGYWEWCNDIIDPNYVYIQHMVMTYLHALMMLRLGVRKSNAGAITDAKAKLSGLIFGGNHPIYQNLMYYEVLDAVLMPSELRDVKSKYVSGSRTGKKEKSQGGDALLEEVNKESKAWLKMSGIPSEEQWLRVFRNLDNLHLVRITTLREVIFREK